MVGPFQQNVIHMFKQSAKQSAKS